MQSLYLSLCSEGPSAKTKEAPLSDGTHKVHTYTDRHTQEDRLEKVTVSLNLLFVSVIE